MNNLQIKMQEQFEKTGKIDFKNLSQVIVRKEIKIEEELSEEGNDGYKITTNKGVYNVEKPVGGELKCGCDNNETCTCTKLPNQMELDITGMDIDEQDLKDVEEILNQKHNNKQFLEIEREMFETKKLVRKLEKLIDKKHQKIMGYIKNLI